MRKKTSARYMTKTIKVLNSQWQCAKVYLTQRTENTVRKTDFNLNSEKKRFHLDEFTVFRRSAWICLPRWQLNYSFKTVRALFLLRGYQIVSETRLRAQFFTIRTPAWQITYISCKTEFSPDLIISYLFLIFNWPLKGTLIRVRDVQRPAELTVSSR